MYQTLPPPASYARTLRAELGLDGNHQPWPLFVALYKHCEGKFRVRLTPAEEPDCKRDKTGCLLVSLPANIDPVEKVNIVAAFCGLELLPKPVRVQDSEKEATWGFAFAKAFLTE